MDKANRQYGVVLFVLAVLFVFFITMPEISTRNGLGAMLHMGRQVIKALDKYRDDHGVYPDNLEMLVPTYIDEIRKPVIHIRKRWPGWRTKSTWVYRPSEDRKNFELYAKDRPFPYDSRTDLWGGTLHH